MALKWGIMSVGKMCNDFVNALNYLPDDEHQVVGVAARKKVKAEKFAAEHNIPLAFGCYEDLAKHKSIDVVYIGSAKTAHYDLCKLVLSNKKHLLCEKPLSLKYENTEELISLAKQNSLFLMEGVWSRFFPVYDELSQLLASNVIGDVIYLKADFGVPFALDNTVRSEEIGGGTIFDLGVSVLQLAIFVLGRKPYSIAAVGQINEYGIDESINYILKYRDGKTANFCTHSKIKMDNSAMIYGSNGYIKIKDPFWAPTVISVNNGEKIRYALPVIERKQYFTHSQGLVYEATEVRNCIEKGLLESPKMTHEDTLTISKWQEEICKLIGSKY
ncbi:unnamed protein product [Nezara viridula]|uniref:Trans-1,2-dihydrobenzene-1,2-diol dehydrogenase n=1 Tax=Nezara viridula TaxID=85310 RepID=A0A9P0ED61_NEZVI|nr:unnamed protein product [Nezara viridula]